MPSSRNELMAFLKRAQMHHHLHALSKSGSAQRDEICSQLEGHGAVLLKQAGLFWNYEGLRTVFILSRERPGFAEVCSGERILLLVGFGGRAVRKAALLRYK